MAYSALLCHCNPHRPAERRMCRSQQNPRRIFLCCQDKRCRFLLWEDKLPPPCAGSSSTRTASTHFEMPSTSSDRPVGSPPSPPISPVVAKRALSSIDSDDEQRPSSSHKRSKPNATQQTILIKCPPPTKHSKSSLFGKVPLLHNSSPTGEANKAPDGADSDGDSWSLPTPPPVPFQRHLSRIPATPSVMAGPWRVRTEGAAVDVDSINNAYTHKNRVEVPRSAMAPRPQRSYRPVPVSKVLTFDDLDKIIKASSDQALVLERQAGGLVQEADRLREQGRQLEELKVYVAREGPWRDGPAMPWAKSENGEMAEGKVVNVAGMKATVKIET